MAQEYQESVQFQGTNLNSQFAPATAGQRQVVEDPQFKQLMDLSKTFTEGVEYYNEKLRKERNLDMYNKALDSPNPEEASKQIRDAQKQIDGDFKIANELAYASYKDNEPEAGVELRNLTGWDKYYYAKGLAEKVGERHKGFVSEALSDPNRVFAGGPKGSFSAADAERDPVLKEVAIKQLRKELVSMYGLEGMKPQFFNEWAGKQIRQNEASFIDEARTNKINEDGAQAREQAKTQLVANIKNNPTTALENYFNIARNGRNSNGKLLSYNEQWADITEIVQNITEQGGTVNMKALESGLIPDDAKGRSYGDLYAARFLELRETIRKGKITNWDNTRKAKAIELTGIVDKYAKEAANNPELASEQGVYSFRNKLRDKGYDYDLIMSATQNLEEKLGEQTPEYGKFLQEKKLFDELDAKGELYPWHLQNASLKAKQTYGRNAAVNLKNAKGGSLEDMEKAVKAIATSGVKPIRDGEYDFATHLMQADLVQEWYAEIGKLEQQMGIQDAARQAADMLNKRVAAGRTTPGSPYYQNPKNGHRYDSYVKWKMGPTYQTSISTDKRLANTLMLVQENKGRIFDVEGVFFDKEDITRIKTLAAKDPTLMSVPSTDPLYAKLYVARQVASKTNTTLNAIIRRQSGGTVNPEAIFETQKTNVSPKTQGIINRIINGNASQGDINQFNYIVDQLGYGATAPHPDIKPVMPGTYRTSSAIPMTRSELDKYVQMKINGKWIALSQAAPHGEGDKEHRARSRPSFGFDYLADKGTLMRYVNGAKEVYSQKDDGGMDLVIIETPDGKRYQLLHGRKPTRN